jgi:phage terminase large subunit-like protein
MGAFPLALLEGAARVCRDSEQAWARFVKGLSPPERRALFEAWGWQAHGGQQAPPGDWRCWLLMAGRGFGKTRAGAEWVAARARETPGARIALVGASEAEAARVMVEGPSGLLSIAHLGDRMVWMPTPGVLRFGNGAECFLYSGRSPEKLRGPEHHFAWADEIAKWARADETWDNLQMGLRLGERPRLVATTTPRPVALVRRVRAANGTAETNGRTTENPHLPAAFTRWAVETYGGTRLGRQELDGMLFEEVAGALFPRAILEKARSEKVPEMKRVLVGVDPPASAEGDSCGIVVCGMGEDGVAYVLADCSVAGERPEGWARAVARAAAAWEADRVIAEKNQGGEMVESVLRAAEAGLPVKLVSASRGKVARAEPVAARFENGRAKLAGRFPELEDELAGLSYGGGYEGPGRSPDRADAMVWAMDALAAPPPPMPWIRQL